MELKSIVLITTGQPSCNPRIVKEANSLHRAGFKVTLLYCFWINWAEKEDKELLKNVQWNYQLIGHSPTVNRKRYFISRIRFKWNKALYTIFGNISLVAEKAQARCYHELVNAAKAIKADWYIGHNLGALSIAVKAAVHNKAKCGFDFEDYHREENLITQKGEKERIEYLETKYIPKLNYISTSSPLISEKVGINFPFFKNPIITLLNCFPLSDTPAFIEKSDSDLTLQLFWFSQTVGSDRGLELVLDVLKILNDSEIHLTLVGYCSDQRKRDFTSRAGLSAERIHFKGIIPPNDIVKMAAKMDIGLAMEPCQPLNRDICLANKIFTYLQAGNVLILTKTSAHIKFQKEFGVGILFNDNELNSFIQTLLFYKNNRKYLLEQKLKNRKLALQRLNWEEENKKLVEILEKQ